MRLTGIWLTWIGGIVIVGAIAVAVMLAMAELNSSGSEVDPIPVSGPGNSVEHFFEAGEETQLWITRPAGIRTGSTPVCEIDGPEAVEPGSHARVTTTILNTTRESFASIRFVESGWYTITCDQAGVDIAPASDFGGTVLRFFGIFGAVLLGGFGVLLAVLGVVLWIIGRRATRRTDQQPAHHPQSV